MLTRFFQTIRAAGVPATIREYLDLLGCLDRGVAFASIDDFYALSRLTLVKDERHYDRFDKAFTQFFDGVTKLTDVFGDIPEDWLRKEAEKHLSAEEMAQIKAAGGFEELLKRLRERLENQDKRHQGGSKNIGTAGTSPFGAYGYNPEGIRIGQAESRHRRAVKVWDQRQFKDYDDRLELGTRSYKVALRRLRAFARTGAPEEFDLDGTIKSTAEQAGMLDIQMRPERRNAVKILMLLDVGGSMDDHVRQVEELFSAATTEFKHFESYYFHNCPYEFLWKNNRRRHDQRVSTLEVLNSYPADYRLIIVGDATMGPYEITYPGGSVEHWNAEPGSVWIDRFQRRFANAVWINPQAERTWNFHASIALLRQLMGERMYPLTLSGLTAAMKELS